MFKRNVARVLMLAGAAFAAMVALGWAFGWAQTTSQAWDYGQHFELTARLWEFDAQYGAGSFSLPFNWVASLSCVLACGLATALMLRRQQTSYASDLSKTLVAGSAAFAWFFLVRVFDEFGVSRQLDSAWVVAVDLIASMLACLALPWFVTFVGSFPTQVTLKWIDTASEKLEAGLRLNASNSVRKTGLARWYGLANRWVEQRSIQFLDRFAAWARRLRLPRMADVCEFQARRARARMAGEDLRPEDQVRHDQLFERWLVLPVQGWTFVFGMMGLAAGWAWRMDWPTPIQYMLWRLPLLWFGPILIFGSLSMIHKYRNGPAEHRRQIEWMIWGILVGLLLFLVPAIVLKPALIDLGVGWLALDRDAVRHWSAFAKLMGLALGIAVVVLSIALSVFYRGAIDPGLALRRTTIYSMLALVLTTVFVGLEGLASASVITSLGVSSQTGALIAGSVTALVFNPVRQRVEIGVERLVNHLRPADLLAEGKRYSAAVMFSDLSGYTALSTRDEKTALTVAALFHKEALRAAEASGGRLVKTIGDSAMTVFPDSAAALIALARLHQRFAIGAELLELPLLPIHSGIHSGEVVEAPNGDIFGATVNLAARLEGQALAGQAVLSESAAISARAAQIELVPAGERRLKNVDAPVECSIWMPASGPAIQAPDGRNPH